MARGFGGLPGGGNMQALLQQAQKMQKDMQKAQAEAERKGLRASGELIRLIKPSATNVAVAVVASAKRAGFSYPSVYEYGGRGKVNATGPRAFLRPGLRKAGPAIQEEMLQVINQTVSKAGFK